MCVVLIFIKKLRLLNDIKQNFTNFTASFKCSIEVDAL